MEDERMIVAEFSDETRADMACMLLETEGITILESGEIANSLRLTPLDAKIQIQVSESDYEKAIEILKNNNLI